MKAVNLGSTKISLCEWSCFVVIFITTRRITILLVSLVNVKSIEGLLRET